MLSNDALKLLEWLSEQDKWMDKQEIIQSCKAYDERSFKTLIKETYLEKNLDVDGTHWVRYRISEPGKAYLKNIRDQRIPELREWINTVIPIITFLAGLSLSDPIKDFFRWLFNLLD